MDLLEISPLKPVKIKNIVSCLCVSHNSFELLHRAIDCFLSQSYRHKELIIVYHRNRHINRDIILKYQRTNIIFHEEDSEKNLTLGDLRNQSVNIANGKYIAIWDDDDWYSEKRLELQMKALKKSKKSACLLTNLIIFDAKNNQAYNSLTRLWEGSLFCERKILIKEFRYPSVGINEDSPLIEKLLDLNYVYPLVNPILYIYVFHGKNTWGHDHFDNNMQMSQKLSSGFSDFITKVLNREIDIAQSSKQLSECKFIKEINYMHNPGREDFIFYPYI